MASARNRGFFQTRESVPIQNEPAAPKAGQKQFFNLPPGQTYDESKSSALLGLFLYSGIMFTVPLLVFFGLNQLLKDYFEVGPPWDHLGAGIAAIVTVNLVILAYVIKAVREVKKESLGPTPKED